MGIMDGLFGSKKKKNSDIFTDEELAAANACPNCWGSQEYDNQVRDKIVEKQIDVNNHSAKHAFIQDFVQNNVDVITLHKSEDGLTCPNCKVRI